MPVHRGARRAKASLRPQLTHFLCLPLINSSSRSQLNASLERFRDDVVAADVPAKAVRPVGALHYTLGVMSLTPEQLKDAVQTLRDMEIPTMLDSNAMVEDPQMDKSQAEPLVISLQGLESMHEPENTSILYVAPHDPTDRVQSFCLSCQKVFKDKQLLVPDERPLKLHATVLNTIYAKGFWPKRKTATMTAADESSGLPVEDIPDSQQSSGSMGHGPNAKTNMRMDARALLEKYKDHVWAEHIILDRIAICEMGAKKRYDEEGRLIGEEYKEVAHISLPI